MITRATEWRPVPARAPFPVNGMPPLGKLMTGRQVADVVNCVRTHFGNDCQDAALPAAVSALR